MKSYRAYKEAYDALAKLVCKDIIPPACAALRDQRGITRAELLGCKIVTETIGGKTQKSATRITVKAYCTTQVLNEATRRYERDYKHSQLQGFDAVFLCDGAGQIELISMRHFARKTRRHSQAYTYRLEYHAEKRNETSIVAMRDPNKPFADGCARMITAVDCLWLLGEDVLRRVVRETDKHRTKQLAFVI